MRERVRVAIGHYVVSAPSQDLALVFQLLEGSHICKLVTIWTFSKHHHICGLQAANKMSCYADLIQTNRPAQEVTNKKMPVASLSR